MRFAYFKNASRKKEPFVHRVYKNTKQKMEEIFLVFLKFEILMLTFLDPDRDL